MSSNSSKKNASLALEAPKPFSAPQEALVAHSGTAPTLEIGQTVGDFKIERLLGKGAFANVYLATQQSLQRKVALKISSIATSEATTLASLEHDNIVKIYSYKPLVQDGPSVLCMQYLPGCTLERIIFELTQSAQPSGEELLKIVDSRTTGENLTFDPKAIEERHRISQSTIEEAALLLGKDIALALSFAHQKGVLHLDIKPGNILVSPYGRPLLMDFNVSLKTSMEETPLGGTLKYMAPEQKALYYAEDEGEFKKLTQNITNTTDIFGLGSVLKEMVSDRLTSEQNYIKRVLQKATNSSQGRRFQSAQEFAEALNNCIELSQIHEALGDRGKMIRALEARPLFSILGFFILTSLMGLIVFEKSNMYHSTLEGMQWHSLKDFSHWRSWHIGIVCPFMGVSLSFLLSPLIRFFKQKELYFTNPQKLIHVRKKTLRLPLKMAGLTTLFWLPALASSWMELSPAELVHPSVIQLQIGTLLLCAIHVSYVFLFTLFMSIRILYPQLWEGCKAIHAQSATELPRSFQRAHLSFSLPALMPLLSAAWLLLNQTLTNIQSAPSERFYLGVIFISLTAIGVLCGFQGMYYIQKTLSAFKRSK